MSKKKGSLRKTTLKAWKGRGPLTATELTEMRTNYLKRLAEDLDWKVQLRREFDALKRLADTVDRAGQETRRRLNALEGTDEDGQPVVSEKVSRQDFDELETRLCWRIAELEKGAAPAPPAKPRPVVCVDLDGVLAAYTAPTGPDKIGDPIPGAQEFVKKLRAFAGVMIFSSRCAHGMQKTRPDADMQIADWLDKWGFPKGIAVHAGAGKPPAAAYIDDKAIECRPQEDPNAFGTSAVLARNLCKEGT